MDLLSPLSQRLSTAAFWIPRKRGLPKGGFVFSRIAAKQGVTA